MVVTGETDLLSQRARFYVVGRADGRPGRFLYKEYVDGTPAARPVALMTYLSAYPVLRETIPCLPLAAVSRTGGGHGVIMRRFTGTPLTNMKSVAGAEMPTRLALALDLALAVALLHAHGVVHGDLTDRNILYDLAGTGEPRVALIDMDMAGVRDGKHWVSGLEPKQAPVQGVYRAPECSSVDPSAAPQPTLETDLWSLAVALHYILLLSSPLAPLGINMTAYSPVTNPGGTIHRWPPRPQSGESPTLMRHRARLDALHPRLQVLFKHTFDQIEGARPEERIGAGSWVKVLRDAHSGL